MNNYKLVQRILDVGEAMLKSGAENFRLEDSLYRMCRAYGFVHADVFVIPSNMQITVETVEGEIITQIRHIEQISVDFDLLDQISGLCRYICDEKPREDEIKKKYDKIMARKQQHPAIKYLAGIMGGTGFTIFFGGDFMDAILAMLVSFVMVAVGDWLGKHEKNLFTHNLIVCFVAGLTIHSMENLGFGHHPHRVMIGCIMLLISALGLANGIRDILESDFISGFLNIMKAILGAAGIATGIALALLILRERATESLSVNMVVNTNLWIQLVSCTTACVGFAYMFKIRGRQVVYAGIGAFLSWAVYALAYGLIPSQFAATVAGAFFVGIYAFVVSRLIKSPSTIFLTAAVVPLLPGPHLYFLMEGCIDNHFYVTYAETRILIEVSLAIAFGFILVDVLIRIIMHLLDKEYHISKKHLSKGKKKIVNDIK
ncbi:MAG: threonine/serine exporter family protein [Eubacteriales bacterium]|nr:threonine/serine exporter family protein [Eubacteriales bacterium]